LSEDARNMGWTQRGPLQVRLEQFEGPLDLLLYLIQSQELDITRVTLSRITDQYLTAIRVHQELDLDVAGDYLVMAATLILWKSKSLIPAEKSDIETLEEVALPLTEEQLLAMLQDRKCYMAIGQWLNNRTLLGAEVFGRTQQRPPIEKLWRPMKLSQMVTAYQDTLLRERRRYKVLLKKETVSLAEKMKEFGSKLTLKHTTALTDLLSKDPSRGEWVVTFLASLELARLKKLHVLQEGTYQPIFVELIDSLMEFDLKLAHGFEYETSAGGPAAP
jgi:segregation and condensation protein A